MTGEAVPGIPPANVTQRDLWLAISDLRTETRDARHEQANNTQRVIAELDQRIQERLRSIERVIDSANPISLGPRINDLERWQTLVNGDPTKGGASARLENLEALADKQAGAVLAARAVVVVMGALSIALGLLAALK